MVPGPNTAGLSHIDKKLSSVLSSWRWRDISSGKGVALEPKLEFGAPTPVSSVVRVIWREFGC